MSPETTTNSIAQEESTERTYWDWLRPREGFPYEFSAWSREVIEIRPIESFFQKPVLRWASFAVSLELLALAVFVVLGREANLLPLLLIFLLPLFLWLLNGLPHWRRRQRFGRVRRIRIESAEKLLVLGATRYPIGEVERIQVVRTVLPGRRQRLELWLEMKRERSLPLLSTEVFPQEEELDTSMERIVRGFASVMKVPLNRVG